MPGLLNTRSMWSCLEALVTAASITTVTASIESHPITRAPRDDGIRT